MVPLVTHPAYSFAFPESHRFPMDKFALLHDYLKGVGIATPTNTFRPGKAKLELLEMAHCPDYVERFVAGTQTPAQLRRMGLPWSEALVKRTLISPNGTLLTALLALEHGVACHLAGGTHHAHYDFASGFCIFNDLAVAARALVAQGKAKRVLIVDCDVHQGDGTAAILAGDSSIFTFSLHCEKNFPARKANSDLDVGLAPYTGDAVYLSTLVQHLNRVLARFKPDFVFYDAGVDIYRGDPLGLLAVSLSGIRQRDKTVLRACMQHQIPIATVIGGGYYEASSAQAGKRSRAEAARALAKRHAIVVEEACKITRPKTEYRFFSR